MLYQSLKSIHYRTLLIFQNKRTTDLRVKTWGGGIKDMLSPPHVKTWGGDTSPHPPRIYALAHSLLVCTTLAFLLIN